MNSVYIEAFSPQPPSPESQRMMGSRHRSESGTRPRSSRNSTRTSPRLINASFPAAAAAAAAAGPHEEPLLLIVPKSTEPRRQQPRALESFKSSKEMLHDIYEEYQWSFTKSFRKTATQPVPKVEEVDDEPEVKPESPPLSNSLRTLRNLRSLSRLRSSSRADFKAPPKNPLAKLDAAISSDKFGERLGGFKWAMAMKTLIGNPEETAE